MIILISDPFTDFNICTIVNTEGVVLEYEVELG